MNDKPRLVTGEMMEVFDVHCVALFPKMGANNMQEMEGLDEFASSLAQGYEPFAVTVAMKTPPAAPLLGSNMQQKPIMGEKVWLKKKSKVPVQPAPVDNAPQKA